MAALNEVAALVLVFHPDYEVLDALLLRLEAQVAKIYVLNNGPEDAAYQLFRVRVLGTKVQLVDMGGNVGVARALNCGFRSAAEDGYEVCWTFDQDSLPGLDDAALLLSSLRRAEAHSGRVVAVVPSVTNLHRGKRIPFLVAAPGNFVREEYVDIEQDVESAITSGMLVNTAAWHDIGGARDDYFIDLVDTEWCLRCRNRRA